MRTRDLAGVKYNKMLAICGPHRRQSCNDTHDFTHRNTHNSTVSSHIFFCLVIIQLQCWQLSICALTKALLVAICTLICLRSFKAIMTEIKMFLFMWYLTLYHWVASRLRLIEAISASDASRFDKIGKLVLWNEFCVTIRYVFASPSGKFYLHLSKALNWFFFFFQLLDFHARTQSDSRSLVCWFHNPNEIE